MKWIRVAEFDGNFQHELPMISLTRRTADEPCVDEWSECAAWARAGWCDATQSLCGADSYARLGITGVRALMRLCAP